MSKYLAISKSQLVLPTMEKPEKGFGVITSPAFMSAYLKEVERYNQHLSGLPRYESNIELVPNQYYTEGVDFKWKPWFDKFNDGKRAVPLSAVAQPGKENCPYYNERYPNKCDKDDCSCDIFKHLPSPGKQLPTGDNALPMEEVCICKPGEPVDPECLVHGKEVELNKWINKAADLQGELTRWKRLYEQDIKQAQPNVTQDSALVKQGLPDSHEAIQNYANGSKEKEEAFVAGINWLAEYVDYDLFMQWSINRKRQQAKPINHLDPEMIEQIELALSFKHESVELAYNQQLIDILYIHYLASVPTKDSAEGKAPVWYTKREMYNWLIQENYSKQIAEELSQKWADDLQGAFKKGWEKASLPAQQIAADVFREDLDIVTNFLRPLMADGNNVATCISILHELKGKLLDLPSGYESYSREFVEGFAKNWIVMKQKVMKETYGSKEYAEILHKPMSYWLDLYIKSLNK